MATVRGFTAERMLEIEQSTVVGGAVDSTGELFLERRDGTQIDGGNVMPGLDLLLPAILDFLYPVGHLYMSVDPANPGTKFGGTWIAWGAGRVPVGVDTTQVEFNTVEKLSGEKTHLLTAAESGLVGHNHTQNAHNHTQNAHVHAQNAHNHTQDAHAHAQNAHTHTWNTDASWPRVWASSLAEQGFTTVVAAAGSNYGIAAIPNVANAAAVLGQGHFSNSNTAATDVNATATNQAATATDQAATATNQAATATNNPVAAADAAQGHNNLQPGITCYMWKRTA